MKKNIIEVSNFSMSFDGVSIIKNISFTLDSGETLALLGSNGSGKTTIIRALLGIYTASSGKLMIYGKPFSAKNNLKIGYLPEERGLYKKEAVLITMVYFGQLKGMSKDDAIKFTKKYLERVDMKDKENTPIEKLSGGQQQKIQIGITIMNNPDILILDEPTKGLDPLNRKLLNEIIQERQLAGATIILITHQMDEVESLANKVILLKDGEIVLNGSLDSIKSEFNNKSLDDIYIEVYQKFNQKI